MKSTIKNKLVVILLLSIIVLGGGGFYLYYQCTHFDEMCNRSTVLFSDNANYTQPKVIISQAQIIGGKKKSSRTRNPGQEEADLIVSMESNSSIGAGNVSYSGHTFTSRQGSGFLGYKSGLEDKQIYTGGGSSMLLAASGSRGYGAGSSVSTSFGGMGGISNPPAFVPFKDGNSNKHALVDPGIEIQMKKITPVGDSLWLLLLLAVAYVGIRRFKSV